jgi:hypothetical protein
VLHNHSTKHSAVLKNYERDKIKKLQGGYSFCYIYNYFGMSNFFGYNLNLAHKIMNYLTP